MAEHVAAAPGGSAMERLREGAPRLRRYCVIALGFTLPIAVAADSVLIVLLPRSWLADGCRRSGTALPASRGEAVR